MLRSIIIMKFVKYFFLKAITQVIFFLTEGFFHIRSLSFFLLVFPMEKNVDTPGILN